MTHLPAHTPKDDQGEGMSEIAELKPCPFCGETYGLSPSYRIKDR